MSGNGRELGEYGLQAYTEVKTVSKCYHLKDLNIMVEFAKVVGSDEVAHNEPPHLNLHCFPYSL